MEIPGLGKVIRDKRFKDWYRSESIQVPVLGGKSCRIVVRRYDEDSNREDFHTAIPNFLSIDQFVMKAAEPHVYRYYKDCYEGYGSEEDGFPLINAPKDVWRHVRLGSEPMVERRHYGDKGIYISLECGCDWEEEHGLQIVFKNGLSVNKVGAYDGHLTNSDAYDDEDLEDVIYYSLR